MTSKLTQRTTDNIGTDLIAVDNSVINDIISKAIAKYETHKLLKIQETENSGAKRSYYLFKRASKKQGFIYQVKYIDPDTNKILPTKYSTNTNDLQTAILFAERNKEALLKQYSGKAELKVLENYFVEGSQYLEFEKMEGRNLTSFVVKQRYGFMRKHIIPFFQSKKIRFLSQITPIHITELNDNLSKKGLNPQTINQNLYSFKKCLILLRKMGKLTLNIESCSFTRKGTSQAMKKREVYELDTLKGIFSKVWRRGLSKILCKIIYFTGMRNSEIMKIQFNDIQKNENGIYFLNVRGTKSKSSVRVVPIHNTLYNDLETYIKENRIDIDKPIFGNACNDTFRRANFDMGKILGFKRKFLVEKGICFYSGRHSYCSMMAISNADKLADIPIEAQQVFGGHCINKAELEKMGIKQYDYIHLNSNSFINRKGIEVLKMIDHYFL